MPGVLVLRKTEVLLEVLLATARSSLPSPSISARSKPIRPGGRSQVHFSGEARGAYRASVPEQRNRVVAPVADDDVHDVVSIDVGDLDPFGIGPGREVDLGGEG